MAESTRPQWYAQLGEVEEGPMTAQTLRSLAEAGKIHPYTPIRKEGMTQSVPAAKVKGLLERSPQRHATDNPSSRKPPRELSHDARDGSEIADFDTSHIGQSSERIKEKKERSETDQIFANRKRKGEFAGVGCLLQAIGIVALFFFPFGTILGIILLIYGSMRSVRLVCSHCGNRLTDKHVKICPTCKAILS